MYIHPFLMKAFYPILGTTGHPSNIFQDKTKTLQLIAFCFCCCFSVPTSGRRIDQEFFQRVKDIPDVGFYSLPKKMGRTSHFIYDGLRLISLGCNTKTKNTNIVQKPNTVLVAVCHFPPSPYRLPVGCTGE